MPLNAAQRHVLTAILSFEQGHSQEEVSATVAKTYNYLTLQEIAEIVQDASQRRKFGRAVSGPDAEGTLSQYIATNFDDSGERIAEGRVEWTTSAGKRVFRTIRLPYHGDMSPEELQQKLVEAAGDMISGVDKGRNYKSELAPAEGVFAVSIVALL